MTAMTIGLSGHGGHSDRAMYSQHQDGGETARRKSNRENPKNRTITSRETQPADPARLRRAVHLDAVRADDASWTVRGGAQEHQVVRGILGYRCDCEDAMYRPGVQCKHQLAVRLRQGVVAPWYPVMPKGVEHKRSPIRKRNPKRLHLSLDSPFTLLPAPAGSNP